MGGPYDSPSVAIEAQLNLDGCALFDLFLDCLKKTPTQCHYKACKSKDNFNITPIRFTWKKKVITLFYYAFVFMCVCVIDKKHVLHSCLCKRLLNRFYFHAMVESSAVAFMWCKISAEFKLKYQLEEILTFWVE